ncbi:MAG: hypothetical protein WAO50_00070 [Candidatus Nanopelagicales bacterium]
MAALTACGAVALIAPLTTASANGDTWQPSTWTGPVAGPPVPGVGLPPAPVPVIAQPLPEGYDVSPTYEGQAQCDPQAKAGTQKLADLIKATYGADQTVWIPRACDVGGQSEHKEGRALDWMVTVRKPQQRANAEAFLAWLLGPDQFGNPYGNAMRLGVMYIGWNDRIWRGYDVERGWTELKGCFSRTTTGSDTVCHRDHIHISLTWDGASGRTSFWDGTPMDGPYCPRAKSSATLVSMGRSADMVGIEPVRVLGTRRAIGVPERCRLQQSTSSSDSKRIYARVTGVGAIPVEGVAAVAVNVTALGSNAPSRIRIWGPGEGKSDIVVKVPMNKDASGTAIVPVANDGTIALANAAGATDLSMDVVGWFGIGDVPNVTVGTPGEATSMSQEQAPAPAPSFEPEPPAPPAPPAPAEPVDEFIAVGSEVGYETDPQGALQPGEERIVGLAAVPPTATAALVMVTTREATKRGKVRFATPDKGSAAAVKFRKDKVRSAVMVVPVVGSQVLLETTRKAAVQVRVEVLGYSVNGAPVKVRNAQRKRIVKAALDPGAPMTVGPITGVAGLPKRGKRITGVILSVTTRTKAVDAGNVSVYGLDKAAPGTRSAPVMPDRRQTSLVVTEVGTDGKIVVQSSVAAKVKVTIVGWIRR